MSDPQDPQAAEPPIDPLNPVSPSPIPPPQPPIQPPNPPLTRREARELAASGASGEPSSVSPVSEGQTMILPTTPTSAAGGSDGEPGFGVPAARGGISAVIAKHPNAWLFSALGVVFVLLATGSIVAGIAVGSANADASPAASAAAPSMSASPTPTRAVPSAIAAAAPFRTCSISAPASNPNLLSFQASIINATTGEVLFDRNGATASPPASVLKTITAAAALSVLGPDYQISTKVYAGASPGTVVLVGGGDPTLSALPDGAQSVYNGAPKLSDLAREAQRASAVPITDIVLDSSYWDSSASANWDPSWERSEQTEGHQPEVTALTIDGGRANPKAQDSPRSSTPIEDAGAAFAADLGISGSEHITMGSAPTGAAVLAEVKSQPVRSLIAYMLPVSDNTLGEYLARVTSKVAGSDGSAASLARVIPAALSKYGLTTTGVSVRDGSGLSGKNAVPAAFVAQLMAKLAGGQQNLNIVYDALPISGKTGTLSGRFTGANSVARGAINAKTGTLRNADTLAGVVHATDGATLAFAFYAIGAINNRTIPALDTLATSVFRCGNNLSNN